jgi:hypothetical protein
MGVEYKKHHQSGMKSHYNAETAKLMKQRGFEMKPSDSHPESFEIVRFPQRFLDQYRSAKVANIKLLKIAKKLDKKKLFEEADMIADMFSLSGSERLKKAAAINHSLKEKDEELAKLYRQALRGWWSNHASDWFGRGKKKQQMSPEQEQAVRQSVQEGLNAPEPDYNLTDTLEDNLPKGNKNLPQQEISEGVSNAFSTLYNEFEGPVQQIVQLTDTLEDSARKYGDYINDLKTKFEQYKEQTIGYYDNPANQKVLDTTWDVIKDDIEGLATVLTSPEIDTALVRDHSKRVLDNLYQMTYADKLHSGFLDRKKELSRMKLKERREQKKHGPKYEGLDEKGRMNKVDRRDTSKHYRGPSAFNQDIVEDIPQSTPVQPRPVGASSKWKTIKKVG